jgi:hypothetical protein
LWSMKDIICIVDDWATNKQAAYHREKGGRHASARRRRRGGS